MQKENETVFFVLAISYLIKKMNEKEKQRVCLKFCLKLNKTICETFLMLREDFGDEWLNQSCFHEWYKWFKDGRLSINDDNVAKINYLLR